MSILRNVPFILEDDFKVVLLYHCEKGEHLVNIYALLLPERKPPFLMGPGRTVVYGIIRPRHNTDNFSRREAEETTGHSPSR